MRHSKMRRRPMKAPLSSSVVSWINEATPWRAVAAASSRPHSVAKLGTDCARMVLENVFAVIITFLISVAMSARVLRPAGSA